MLPDDMRKEPGTCNVCCAPCSSCMHRISDSNVKHDCTKEEASSCSFVGAKTRACYKAQHAASEASNLLSASSSQNSYSGSVESLSVMRSLAVDETSEAVEIPFEFPKVDKVGQNQRLHGKLSRTVSELCHNTMNDEHHDECLGDNGLDLLGAGDCDNLVMDFDTDQWKSMAFACALKCPSSDKKMKTTTNSTVNQLVSGKESLHEKSRVLPMLCKFDEKPIECLAGVIKSSYEGPLTVVSGVTENPTSLNAEAIQTGQTRNKISSQVLENGNNDCKRAVEVDEYHEIATCNENNEVLEKHNSRESNEQGLQVQGQPHSMAEAQHSDSDNGLIDVNVCDICGDAGREAFLATCSRCTDGAEHIYCMRVKLDKVPEGNWVCEECEIKVKTETRKNCDSILISHNTEGCMKMSLKPEGTSGANSSAKFGAKSVYSKTNKFLQVKRNSFKLHKHTIPAGTIPAVIKEQSESSSGLMVSPSPGKSVTFSNIKSLKRMKEIKQKSNAVSSPRDQSSSSFQALSRTSSTGSIPLKVQKDICSPKGLSKQVSFDISKIRPKDKLLSEGQAQKLVRASASNGTTKDASARSLERSASFKSVNSGSLRAELVNEAQVLKPLRLENRDTSVDNIQPLKSPRSEDQSGTGPPKEKNKIGRQDLTFPGRPIVSPSLRARVHPLKVEQKTPFDVKVHTKPYPTALSTGRTLNNASVLRYEERKVQNSSSTRTSVSENKRSNLNAVVSEVGSENKRSSLSAVYAEEGSSKHNIFTNRSRFDIDKSPGKSATKTLSLTGSLYLGKKLKNSANSPKKAVASSDKEIGIHEDSDANHATKFCIKNPPDAAEGTSRVGRLKDVFQAASQKNKMDKNRKSLEQIEERSMSTNNDASHTTKFCITRKLTDTAKGTNGKGRLQDAFQAVIREMDKNSRFLGDITECTGTSNSTIGNVAPKSSLVPNSQKGLPMKDDCKWQQNSDSCDTEVDCPMQQAKQMDAASCLSRLTNMDAAVANPDKITPDKIHTNFSTQIFPAESPVTSSAAASVIPQHEFIWQGAFEILSKGNSPKLVDGIQAHLASSVSPKMLEVVRHIPTKVQLEEVPRVTVWPVQFQETSPSDENIALYFFANDAYSYEKSYQKLMEWVLRNDMALRGVINEVELLIFPSNKLPDTSQRWNMLLFLWGVFRAKVENSSRPHSDLYEECCLSNLSKDHSSSLPCEMSIIQKIASDDCPDKTNVTITPGISQAEENSFDAVKLEKATHAHEVQLQGFCGPLPKCSSYSYFEGCEENSSQEEKRSEVVSVKPEIALEERNVQSNHLIWSQKPNLKRSYSCLAGTDNKAFKVFTRSDSWHEKRACLSEEDDKEVVRIKCHDEGHEINRPRDHAIVRNPSAKVFQLFGKVVEQLHSDIHSESLPSECPSNNQVLRLIDQGLQKSSITNSRGRIYPSEVKEAPVADSPDLELSLGPPKVMSKAAIPLLSLSVADRSKHISHGDLSVNEESITLSLASPGAESGNSRKPTGKSEQLFPEGSFYKTCRAPFKSFAYT